VALPEWALDAAAFVPALVALARLAGFLRGARLTSDECYHATMARWIAAHGALPLQIDALYSGFKYFYPPLFHLLGAGWVRLFGADAFASLNLALLAALLATTWAMLARLHSRVAARVAVLLLVAYPALAVQGVHLFVEALSTLLTVTTTIAIWGVLRCPSPRGGVVAGIGAGLAILAKQSGLGFLPVLAALALLAAARRRRAEERALALALGVACALALPYWWRNAALFGSPLYPLFGRDLDPLLVQLNRSGFTPGPRVFFAHTLADLGGPLAAVLAAALVVALARRRGPETLVFVGGTVLLLLAPTVPMLDSRHVVPLVATLLVFAAIVLVSAFPRARGALQWAAVLGAGVAVFLMPDLRAPFNLGPAMDAVYDVIRREVPATSRILAIETYTTQYYTGRATTWPIPWGQADPPVAIFYDTDPDSVRAHLSRYGIDWLLLPTRTRAERFNSANFPRPFLLALARLKEAGGAEIAWTDGEQLLLHVPPAPARDGRR
jgi:4-amino-4-deoxy-L-arabinose transferase-like glycosyltransferase